MGSFPEMTIEPTQVSFELIQFFMIVKNSFPVCSGAR